MVTVLGAFVLGFCRTSARDEIVSGSPSVFEVFVVRRSAVYCSFLKPRGKPFTMTLACFYFV